MVHTKSELLSYFRSYADEKLAELPRNCSKKQKAATLNQQIQALCDNMIARDISLYATAEARLNFVLLISYVRDVVMLEYRNKVWPYEYMAFSRRIGEIWEPFCKLPFSYPVKTLAIETPPTYDSVKDDMIARYRSILDSFDLSTQEIDCLMESYLKVWKILDSGNISLSLDLHFSQNGVKYNVDFKSGFGSNEKGNTNRLLQVASVYSMIDTTSKNLIFVRQGEEENNHYLQVLKHSPYWEVYCANQAYEKIREYTGFDLRSWINTNMDWPNDITCEFRAYLEGQDLIRYLSW